MRLSHLQICLLIESFQKSHQFINLLYFHQGIDFHIDHNLIELIQLLGYCFDLSIQACQNCLLDSVVVYQIILNYRQGILDSLELSNFGDMQYGNCACREGVCNYLAHQQCSFRKGKYYSYIRLVTFLCFRGTLLLFRHCTVLLALAQGIF